MQETWVRSLGREDPLRRKWQPTPGFLPGESHGRRSLVGYSPRGRKESDTTEWLHFHFLCIHTQFRIQQGSIACLYPIRDATISRFIPNSGPNVCTPLTNNDVCICISLSIFQQSWNLGLHLLIKTAREAISTTPLYVLQDCNHYSAILKPLFLPHI